MFYFKETLLGQIDEEKVTNEDTFLEIRRIEKQISQRRRQAQSAANLPKSANLADRKEHTHFGDAISRILLDF